MSKLFFLTGFMGAGKTTVGRLLEAELGWAFVDLDETIEQKSGREIAEIFRNDGEQAFRELESQALRTIITLARGDRPLAVALGGGTLIREENRELVLASGELIYLEASIQELSARLARESGARRPLLSNDLIQLIELRKPGYEMAAHRISTGARDPSQIAREIGELHEALR